MKTDAIDEAAVEYFAAHAHNEWRRQFHKANPQEAKKPRMRMRGGALVDINRPWKDLDPRAQADNKAAGYAAQKALLKHPNDREAAAAYVHKRWIKRNQGDPNQPKELFKPYSDLPEAEKDKDRAHIDQMKAALAAVKKPVRVKKPAKKAAKTAKGKKARGNGAAQPPQSFALDAKTAQRLKTVAKRLSAMTGRKVAPEELVRASVAAMLSIYEATAK